MPSLVLLSWWRASRLVGLSFRAIACIFFFTCPACSSAAEEVVPEASAAVTAQLVSLSINGQPADSAVLVLQDHQNDWLIPSEILSSARVRMPEQNAMVTVEGVAYVPLSLLKVSLLSFDQQNQSLHIRFDPSAFDTNRVTLQSGYQSAPAQVPEGMFINYDLLLTGGSSSRSESLFAEWGVSVGKGIGLLNVASISNERSHRFLRLDTSYTQNRLDDMATWRLGDAITRPATSLGRPVRFGGIQYSTDFRLRPGLVTVPVPTLSGQAALPSTAELYVNNVLQSSTALPPGPFSITTAPLITGDGDVLLRVRDIAGREELISGRFYSSTILLAPGLSDFSIEAGALRNNYALPDDHYAKPFVSGAYRRGMTDRLTLEGGGSMASGGPAELLGSGAIAIPGVGIASLAAGVSNDREGIGRQFAASFERRTLQTSLALRAERSDSRYRQLGIDPLWRVRNLDMGFFSYRLDGLGTLGLSYTRQQRASYTATEVIGVSFSTLPSRMGSFIVNAMQFRGGEKNTAVSLFWILPLGSDISANLSHTANQHSPDTTVLQVHKNAPYGEGMGWRLQTAIHAAQQAAVYLQKPYGTLTAEAASLRGEDSARIGMSGAVVRMNDRWFPTRRITGSYGLVHLPGIQDARIYVDNQFSTRTDKEGYALLPRLRPHVQNHVSVEQQDLPLDIRVDQLIARPVPGWRSGVLVNFAIKKASAATLRIVDEQGNDIPAGASVGIRGRIETFAVGKEGVAYVEGMTADSRLEIRWAGRLCLCEVPYAPSDDIVPYLGEFVCKQARE